jgi:hypothetical protein
MNGELSRNTKFAGTFYMVAEPDTVLPFGFAMNKTATV